MILIIKNEKISNIDKKTLIFICKPYWTFKKKKKDCIVIDIFQQIIIDIVKDEIICYIIYLKDLNEIWNKLKNIYTKISQRVIYSILQ